MQVVYLVLRSGVDVIKPLRCYAVCLSPYAASDGVNLTHVNTTLDGLLTTLNGSLRP